MSKQIIGFATQFYTLWNTWSDEQYFTDAYGKHHLSSVTTHFDYIKNISTDLAKVNELYPNLSIDENLRGKTASWERAEKIEDTTPEILKFGKYSGKHIADVAKLDFKYLIWLIENVSQRKVKDAIMLLPEVIAYFAEKEAESEALKSSYAQIESGLVELEFISNPNRTGRDYFPSEKFNKLGEIPSTLVWETPEPFNSNQNVNRKAILAAKSEYSHSGYKIYQWDGQSGFCFDNNSPVDTIEEAKTQAEIQELVNAHKLDQYYQPTEFNFLKDRYYAEAIIGEGSRVIVFFDDIKSVSGMYPYNMAIIDGKAMKIKGKKMKLNLEVLETIRSEFGVTQIAVVK